MEKNAGGYKSVTEINRYRFNMLWETITYADNPLATPQGVVYYAMGELVHNDEEPEFAIIRAEYDVFKIGNIEIKKRQIEALYEFGNIIRPLSDLEISRVGADNEHINRVLDKFEALLH